MERRKGEWEKVQESEKSGKRRKEGKEEERDRVKESLSAIGGNSGS